MRAKSKRIQTTYDICKFYLHLHTQISNNQSLVFPILLRTVQSEISCVHHLFSVNCAFLFFVVRLRLMGIFERIAKILQFLKKIHGDYFRLYLNLFKPSQVTNVKIHTFTCCAPKIKTSIDCIQKYRFHFPKFRVKNLSLVLFYCLKNLNLTLPKLYM